jgi:N-methylhydantoinase A
MEIKRYVDLRYALQAFELTIPINNEKLNMETISNMQIFFHDEHEKTYGHKSEEAPIEIVNIRIRISKVTDKRGINLKNIL